MVHGKSWLFKERPIFIAAHVELKHIRGLGMSTDINDEKLFNEVFSAYNELGSIKETADKLQLSRSKVRKILITTGDLTSDNTDKSLQYIYSGKSQVETADILGISTATLSTYLPYGNRVYNRDQKSDTTLRVEACRARQARAASNQVNTVKKEVGHDY